MNGRETPGNINMSVSVLTMGFWPTYQPVSAILPPEVNSNSSIPFFFYNVSFDLVMSITRNIYEILFK